MVTFPLKHRPAESYKEPPRSFRAPRDKGRLHAGCDLYAPVGTEILAMADGVVTQGKYAFYLGTFAIEIDHGEFLARYGEIRDVAPGVTEGSHVTAGQVIAYVGRLDGLNMSMLHLETNSKQAKGGLTDRNAPPFQRRSDLVDPTARLDGATLSA